MDSQKHLDMSLTWDDINLHAKSLAMKLADKGPGMKLQMESWIRLQKLICSNI